MCKTIIKGNYFVEYEYTEDNQFNVTIQELEGSDRVFVYLFDIIRKSTDQDLDLIDDAIFHHERLTKATNGE